MGIFDKLFGTKKISTPSKGQTDNYKLIGFLKNYNENRSQENYTAALNEILEGNSHLVLPSINDGQETGEWNTLEKDMVLKLTSVFDQDGLKVLGAFTSPERLVEWTNAETEYTQMNSKDVIDFCQTQGIDRIVIDTDMPTMFILERNRDNITTETIKEEAQVQVGTPRRPISGEHLEKFRANFAKVSVIEEVYHYLMIRNGESILILGFILDTYSDDSRAACINSVNNAIEGEQLDLPLELIMLDDEGWQKTVKDIDNSLIFKR